mgnify:CR=1 FL=1|tara:strand:+ start:1039 stop:1254 length:216 start_codon:yes stop_codon:yes gene_type:complete
MTYKTISLNDRLKPHYADKLEKLNMEYPLLVGSVVDALESQSFVSDLKYKDILEMNFLLNSNDPFVYFKEL